MLTARLQFQLLSSFISERRSLLMQLLGVKNGRRSKINKTAEAGASRLTGGGVRPLLPRSNSRTLT
jgi:hypothetical protein